MGWRATSSGTRGATVREVDSVTACCWLSLRRTLLACWLVWLAASTGWTVRLLLVAVTARWVCWVVASTRVCEGVAVLGRLGTCTAALLADGC